MQRIKILNVMIIVMVMVFAKQTGLANVIKDILVKHVNLKIRVIANKIVMEMELANQIIPVNVK